MTNPGDRGSSFVQTPAPDIKHRHSHYDVHHPRDAADAHMRMHLHHHRQHNQHVRPNAQLAPKTPDPELDPSKDQDLRRRQAGGVSDLDSLITRIIQTVSVIQYVDGSGSPIDVSTVFSPPVTELVDEATGTTRTLSPADTVSSESLPPPASTASSAPSPGSSLASSSLPTSSSTSTGTGTVTSTSSTPPVPTTFLSSLAPSSSLNSTTFPSLTGSFNSSSSATTLPFSNTTVRSFFTNSSSTTETSISFTTSESSSTSLTSFSSSSTTRSSSSSSTASPSSATGGGFGGGGGSGDGPAAPTGAAATPVPASNSATPTPAIVGGVVGSICGVALLVFAVVFLLRWRKQQQQAGHKRLGEGGTAPPGSSGGFSTRMSQRASPFSVPSALAALSGAGAGAKQITSPQSSGGGGETSERGFYRVSGRKLPSVLQHGGDGYTNPHVSTMSDESEIMYRDSQAFFTGAPPTRLAVGSPMRPESGIAVMNPGPARTPVAGQSPHLEASPTLSPPPAPATPSSSLATPRDSLMPQPLRPAAPPPRVDAIGRSRPSLDRSQASASRFSEHLS
ncbi:hypothetical protein RB595_006720 [Gaeumannomyces hyphopodioides]